MNKSIKNAFTYMFKDEKWFFKVSLIAIIFILIWAVFCFILSQFLMLIKTVGPNGQPQFNQPEFIFLNNVLQIFGAFVMIIIFYVIGYWAKCTYNIIHNNGADTISLPSFKDGFLNTYIIGAKLTLSAAALMYLFYPAILLFVVPFFVIIFLFGIILVNALKRVFCEEFKFEAFFAWKEGFALIKNNVSLYVSIVLTQIALSIINIGMLILFYHLKFPPNIIALLVGLYTTYVYFVNAYLVGIVGSKKELVQEAVPV